MLFWQPGRNPWFGVPLPWTLADAYIWKKSWRLASRLLMVMGITVLISWRAFFISAAHLIGLSCLYTVLLYRWKYGTWRFWKDLGWIDYHPAVRCAHCGHFQKLRQAERRARGRLRGLRASLPQPGTWASSPRRLFSKLLAHLIRPTGAESQESARALRLGH